jgi:hypothetical protein
VFELALPDLGTLALGFTFSELSARASHLVANEPESLMLSELRERGRDEALGRDFDESCRDWSLFGAIAAVGVVRAGAEGSVSFGLWIAAMSTSSCSDMG